MQNDIVTCQPYVSWTVWFDLSFFLYVCTLHFICWNFCLYWEGLYSCSWLQTSKFYLYGLWWSSLSS